MSADKVKEQLEFERNVKVGDQCLAHWTNCGNYYETHLEAGVMPGKEVK